MRPFPATSSDATIAILSLPPAVQYCAGVGACEVNLSLPPVVKLVGAVDKADTGRPSSLVRGLPRTGDGTPRDSAPRS